MRVSDVWKGIISPLAMLKVLFSPLKSDATKKRFINIVLDLTIVPCFICEIIKRVWSFLLPRINISYSH